MEVVVRDIVVKQTVAALPQGVVARSALEEGRLLEMLAAAKSKYIIRQYGSPFEDVFANREVVRIFLEYCPGGDLSKLMEIEDNVKNPKSFEEEDIWSVFNCLALGVFVMDRGTEQLGVAAWQKPTEICHFE